MLCRGLAVASVHVSMPSAEVWICRVIVADIFMILTGLFGAMSSHSPRWGFFGVSCFFEILIGYALLVPGMKYAFLRGKAIGSFYAGLAILLFITWWGYPIVWGFAEGANYISVDAEVGPQARCFLQAIGKLQMPLLQMSAAFGPQPFMGHRPFLSILWCHKLLLWYWLLLQ